MMIDGRFHHAQLGRLGKSTAIEHLWPADAELLQDVHAILLHLNQNQRLHQNSDTGITVGRESGGN
jgi:hypothetical protein